MTQHIYLEGDSAIEVEEYTELDFESVTLGHEYRPWLEAGYCGSCGHTVTRSQIEDDQCAICGAELWDMV